MKNKNNIPLQHRLSFRQARNSVLLAFIVGILLSGIQIVFDYHREQDALEQFVNEILSATKFAAADAAFHLDSQAAHEVAKGLLEYRPIYNITVTTETGLELTNLSRSSVVKKTENNELKLFGDLQKHSVPLFSSTGELIGRFSIVIDPAIASSDFVNRSVLIIGFGIIRNILLAFLLILLFHYTITKRLVAITRFLSGVDINKPKHIHFDPATHSSYQDELTELAHGINSMLEIISKDIEEREEREKNLLESDALLSYQANHDALTGLFNRREFESRLQRLLKVTHIEKTEHVMCYLDLDQFKIINDTCGHFAGDELLRQLCHVLQQTIRKHDTLARLGGDEFGVLMEDCSIEDAIRVAKNLCTQVEKYRFAWDNQYFSLGVSIGVVAINHLSTSSIELFQAADAACYAAKDAGRNQIHVYIEDDVETAKRHSEMQWIVKINKAIEEKRFMLYAQSIVSLKDNMSGYHYEILLRMVDENGKIIQPGSFLPAAERYNLMTKLDRLVIQMVIDFFREHPEQLHQLSLCSINLSGQSLTAPGFIDYILELFSNYNIPAEKICFEITETAAISNMAMASKFIHVMKEQGCYFALDDFGSGLSSFAYLKNLPVDYLKIDGMFVKDIVEDPIDYAMVKSIHEIGKVMNKKTIAEFVENTAIQEKLREIGVDYAQGYAISMPQPVEDFILLSNKKII